MGAAPGEEKTWEGRVHPAAAAATCRSLRIPPGAVRCAPAAPGSPAPCGMRARFSRLIQKLKKRIGKEKCKNVIKNKKIKRKLKIKVRTSKGKKEKKKKCKAGSSGRHGGRSRGRQRAELGGRRSPALPHAGPPFPSGDPSPQPLTSQSSSYLTLSASFHNMASSVRTRCAANGTARPPPRAVNPRGRWRRAAAPRTELSWQA